MRFLLILVFLLAAVNAWAIDERDMFEFTGSWWAKYNDYFFPVEISPEVNCRRILIHEECCVPMHVDGIGVLSLCKRDSKEILIYAEHNKVATCRGGIKTKFRVESQTAGIIDVDLGPSLISCTNNILLFRR